MNESMIVASARERAAAGRSLRADDVRSWLVLGWIGLVFLTIGGADFALTWLPTGFGNREWEFGTVTQSFNSLPIVLLGLGLLIAAGEQAGRDWWRALGVALAAILLVWIVVGAAFWMLSVQIAFATVPDNLALGLRKAAAKTALQSLVYPATLVYLLRRAWLAGVRDAAADE